MSGNQGQELTFRLVGLGSPAHAVPLSKAVASQPRRKLAGWLLPFLAVSAVQGGTHLIADRDGQTFDAAAAGTIDWSGFINSGYWSDTHKPQIVGAPTYLDYLGPGAALAKAHGCAGWLQAGHLWDRRDPSTWLDFLTQRPDKDGRPSGRPFRPSDLELERADFFWERGEALAKAGGALAFSVEGTCWTSPCRRRIVRAAIRGSAVALTPKNPWAAAAPLEQTLAKAITDQDAFLRAMRDNTGRQCGRCRCSAPCVDAAPQDLGKGEELRDSLRSRYAQQFNVSPAEADMHLRTAFAFLNKVQAGSAP